ncbi:MAG TPA: cupredoxin domain-containing protein [Candidatus Limnocylindria bacterium]|nr:cupredoxin domain-containing protein [Candidatus Limnocylindria bacterium]
MKRLAFLLLLVVVAGACAPAARRQAAVDIGIHYSHYSTTRIDVPAGVPVTFTIHNDDPIDHEWLLGDLAMHERHRTGAEPVHAARPDELTVPALSSRTTTLTFPVAMTLTYMCHLPGHEAYGMVGTLVARN